MMNVTNNLRAGFFLCFFFFLCPLFSMAQKDAGYFRASVVKKDITPDDPQYLAGYQARQSDGVLHRIYHRIVAIDDGTTQFFLVASDIGKIDPSEYESVVAQLKKHGIRRENLWWSVTHTHSAPEIGPPGLSAIFMPERYKQPVATKYTAFSEKQLIEGVLEARNNLVPARIAAGWGFSQANISRRAIDVDGKASLGLNPDAPVDRRIGLLRIDKEDGSPLAVIANYAIHGTVMGPENLKISGDAPGVVSEYVEQQVGAPTLFINGAAGDIAPIYSVYSSARTGHLDQFKVLLGDKIVEAYRKISPAKNAVRLTLGSLTVETPRKKGLDWPSNLGDYTRTTKEGINLIRVPIRFLKINDDVAIWSAPLELFCEISMEVRNRSPFPYTFYFGYTNGNLRYMPTAKAWEHGGYEPGASPFTPSAEKDISVSVVSYLQGELRNNK